MNESVKRTRAEAHSNRSTKYSGTNVPLKELRELTFQYPCTAKS